MTPQGRVAADVFVLLATGMMTLAVVGLMRIPDTFGKIHASSKASLLAVLLTLAAAIGSGALPMIARGAMVAGFLLLTAPVSAHALAHLAWTRSRRAR